MVDCRKGQQQGGQCPLQGCATLSCPSRPIQVYFSLSCFDQVLTDCAVLIILCMYVDFAFPAAAEKRKFLSVRT